MHILIIGGNGVGKSAFIERLLKGVPLPLYGFVTEKETAARAGDAEKVYIHAVSGQRTYTQENLVGTCTNHRSTRFPAAFNRAVHYLRHIPSGSIVVMDELGVMETDARDFCDAVMECLNGDNLVVAAVRDKESPFLNTVCGHPRAKCFFMTPENAETLFAEVKSFLEEQVKVSTERFL